MWFHVFCIDYRYNLAATHFKKFITQYSFILELFICCDYVLTLHNMEFSVHWNRPPLERVYAKLYTEQIANL